MRKTDKKPTQGQGERRKEKGKTRAERRRKEEQEKGSKRDAKVKRGLRRRETCRSSHGLRISEMASQGWKEMERERKTLSPWHEPSPTFATNGK